MAGMPASSSAPLAKSASGRVPYVWTTISLISCIAVLYARMSGSVQWAPLNFHLAAFRFIICSVPNPDPLRGIVPRAVHPVNDGETTISQYVEKIEGEVALDAYVKAQTSAPEVVKRITELENCLQRLANAVLALSDIDKRPELRAAAEEAKLLLKNRLEVDATKHRFHSELGVFNDRLRIIKD